MPCLISKDVHERTNDQAAVPDFRPVNPQNGERAVMFVREEKTPWSFTAVYFWGTFLFAKDRWELRRLNSGLAGATLRYHPYKEVFLTCYGKDICRWAVSVGRLAQEKIS